jgi:hypothetical protein
MIHRPARGQPPVSPRLTGRTRAPATPDRASPGLAAPTRISSGLVRHALSQTNTSTKHDPLSQTLTSTRVEHLSQTGDSRG